MLSAITTRRFHSTRNLNVEPLERRQLMAATAPAFVQTNLVSDGAVTATHTDANLVNPWGLAVTSFGTIWVGNEGTGTSTVYDQAGTPGTPVVSIAAPAGTDPGDSGPTGVVFNATKSFNLPGTSTPAAYLFATHAGTLAEWGPSLGATAVVPVDNSAAGASYTGVAIAGKGKKAIALAANFAAGKIDAFDSSLAPVTQPAGAFTDPTLPAGYSPFNVQTIKSKVYVAYALIDSGDEVKGAGNGFVNVYNTKGKLLNRLASAGALNAPWGLAGFSAPGLKNAILVGNFGDGTINAFSTKGKSLGALKDAAGNPVVNDGLWGIEPGVGDKKNTLFFAAGINDEADGLFGTLVAQKPVKSSGGNNNSNNSSNGGGNNGGGGIYG
jgi:uncharacterized protein (TIGR03118 family)